MYSLTFQVVMLNAFSPNYCYMWQLGFLKLLYYKLNTLSCVYLGS